jgi:O-antigen/teichoic acid export membrane protein
VRLRLPDQLRSTLVYLATIFLTQLAGFLLLPVVTRFLGPAAYGEYAVALAVAGLVGMFASSWIRNVAFRFYFDAQKSGTTRSFYWSLAALQAAVLLAVVAVFVGWTLASAQPLIPLATVLASAAMVLTTDFFALTVAFLRAEKLSTRFAVAEVSGAAIRLGGTTVGLALGFTSPAFLFLAAAAASVVGGAIALQALRRRLSGPARLDTAVMRAVAVRAPGALPFSVGEWLYTLADRLILDLFATRAIVGVYAAGQGLGDRLVGGLVMAVFMMAWPDVLSAWNDGGVARARVAVRRYIQLFLWLTVGPVVALALYADAIVLLLGGGYRDAVDVIALVAVAAWMRGLGNCFNRHHELRKRFWVMSVVTLVGAAVNVALNFALVPTFLAVGAATATLASQSVVMLVFFVIRDRELVDFPVRDAVWVVGAVVAAAALAWPLGGGIAGMVVFAFAYAAAMAAVWGRRMRAGG